MKNILLIPLSLLLASCASLEDIANVLTGNTSQKITRDPIWLYMPDLVLSVDGSSFYGMGVTQLKDETDIGVFSQVHIDRVEVSSCSRHDVCQIKGGAMACNSSRFDISTDWFGNAGKKMTYHFSPSQREKDDSCSNLLIAVYDKNALAAWGYMFFRDSPDKNFGATFSCNATDWTFSGVSVCAAKAGTMQEINLGDDAETFRSTSPCQMVQKSKREFEFQPQLGWCRASFMRKDHKRHDVVLLGYDEVLIRDGKE